jgi:hypothetical protein
VAFRRVAWSNVAYRSPEEALMPLRSLTLTLSSTTELLMDRDNISFAEEVVRWTKDPDNAEAQRAGDDRAPAWGWLGKLHYGLDGFVGIPENMLGPCIRGAGAMIPHPTLRGGKTLKEASQSGIQFAQTSYPLFVPTLDGWTPIAYEPLYAQLKEEEDFSQHEAVVKTLGFTLDVRRAKPQYNRTHIRVRPMLRSWRCVCGLAISDDVLSDDLVVKLFTLAGTHKGIGNWRPSVGKAGSYGMFGVEVGVPKDLADAVKALGEMGKG